MLCAGTNSVANTNAVFLTVDTGTNLVASLEALAPGRWYFHARAKLDNVLSDPSNELAVEVPAAPAQFRTVAIQHTLTVGGTNWQDVGFFRLKLE